MSAPRDAAEPFRNLEADVCDVRLAALIAHRIVGEALKLVGQSERDGRVTFLLSREELAVIDYATLQVTHLSGTLQDRFFAATRGEAVPV